MPARLEGQPHHKYGGQPQGAAPTTSIIREIIIPAIEHEVNEGAHFAKLRQIYHSMILATWFKRNLKEHLLSKVYVEQNKVEGVDVEDKDIKHKIYNQYLEAFKTGVYDYIREDYDPVTETIIPRKYFSGGMKFQFKDLAMQVIKKGDLTHQGKITRFLEYTGDLIKKGKLILINSVFTKVPSLKKSILIASIAGILISPTMVSQEAKALSLTERAAMFFSKKEAKKIMTNEKRFGQVAIKDIKDPYERNNLEKIDNLINWAMEKKITPDELEEIIKPLEEKSEDIQQGYAYARMVEVFEEDSTATPSLTFQYYILKVAQFVKNYNLFSYGITDDLQRKKILKILNKVGYVGYIDIPNIRGVSHSGPEWWPFKKVAAEGIDLRVTDIRDIFKVATHEFAHDIADSNISEFDSIGIKAHDDIRWLLAQAQGVYLELEPADSHEKKVEILNAFLGQWYPGGIESVQREQTPHATYAKLRGIPYLESNLWMDDKEYIKQNLSGSEFDVDAYGRGALLAAYVYYYFHGGEISKDAGAFLLRLHGTMHDDLNFAEMELAGNLAKELDGYELKNRRHEVEDLIVEIVKGQKVYYGTTYEVLGWIRDDAKEILHGQLALRGIKSKSDGNRYVRNDRSMLNSNITSRPQKTGGIDFDPGLLELETRGDGVGFDGVFAGVPCLEEDEAAGGCQEFDWQALETMPITGFTPVIIRMLPVVSLQTLGMVAD